MSKYIIRNCPACRIAPDCCTEWNLLHGEWKECENITDCLLKRIVERCNAHKKFYEKNYLPVRNVQIADEILRMLDIQEVE